MKPADNGSEKSTEAVGAALVVGAGIAGMQAALDLAEAGIKVYLLDRSSAIGGTMAMLDKTFPTDDCAMCIMSPKLVEVGRHINIELLTCAEIEALSGHPGNFTATIKQHPRYVDIEKCTGCGDCASACPISLPDEFNGRLSRRKAIYKLYPQAIPNAFAIEKRGMSPCRDACPINQRVQGYLALVAEGRFADAYRTILEENPFPSICGRVCTHRCEEACNRAQADAPVNIMGIKRFVADWAWDHPEEVEAITGKLSNQPTDTPLPLQGRRVAIVGSGPAGLTCALDLTRKGCQVTVFEALPAPGGMMRVGIPAHRLPPEIVQREIEAILRQGIDLRLNQPVENVEALLDEYDAVFAAVGAHKGVKLPIPGNDLPGVLQATDFLREVALMTAGETVKPASDLQAQFENRRVLVLGGGDVAVDAAMTAMRLGASWVGMACLEGRHQMPAHEWELSDAEEEGVVIYPSRAFEEVLSHTGRAAGVLTVGVNFRGFVEGRPDYDELPDTQEVILADTVIFAVGQRPDTGCLTQARRLRNGRVEVDPVTLATSLPGIFSGGDAVTGTNSIVSAIAAGHRAARSIGAYLDGVLESDQSLVPTDRPVARLTLEDVQEILASQAASNNPRLEVPKRSANERKSDFIEIAGRLTEAQARAEASRCLRCGICSECNQCVYACQAGAIVHNQEEQLLDLQVGAVIIATGLEPMPGDIRPEFGYGRFPNVITSLQFERMLSASGPFQGVVQRPSDGAHPHKIAWIQCVGSRDYSDGNCQLERGAYCSSVCCMYATKEAVIAKEHDPQIEPAIFYIDIRSYGKGFERYIDRAKTEHDIRYTRCMVSAVKEVPGTHNLRLEYVNYEGSDGRRPVSREEEFELVVLAVGLRPTKASRDLAARLGFDLNEFGFAAVETFQPGQTSQEGLFVAGTFSEPKDIPESVVEASCAAAQVSALLSTARSTQTRIPLYPSERDVSDEPPRVGVFICHCGINIAGVVDVSEVVDYAKTLPGVVYAEHNLYTCSQDTQARLTRVIQEHGLNRVVVSSCTPRTHEPLFQDTLRQAGINPYLFEMANIREQDAWVHRASPQAATEKAMQLTAMAVAKARKLRAIQRNQFEVDRRALVLGGGLAGMKTALSIAQQGFDVFLVERQSMLGGNLRHIYTGTFQGEDPQQLLHQTVEQVINEPRIQVMTDTELVDLGGYTGQFCSTLRLSDGTQQELHHGAIVVATGAREITPNEYLYDQHPRVMTQRQLEERLTDPGFIDGLSGSTLTMIQCVGSRDQQHPYCSRICCTQALKNALKIKEMVNVDRLVVLYRDLRSYGFREQLYRQARQAGVIFLEYDPDKKPQVTAQGDSRLLVQVYAQPENERITLSSDWLILSAGIEPDPENARLAQLLKVPLNENGFFLEAHIKLRPVDFAAEGIFLAGLAHSPRSIDETIAQAQAAAVHVAALLSKPHLEAPPIVAQVNPRLCSACGLCVEICPYGARVLEPGSDYAEVMEVLCQGCGACVSACPNKASQQKGFEFSQVFGMIEALVSGPSTIEISKGK